MAPKRKHSASSAHGQHKTTQKKQQQKQQKRSHGDGEREESKLDHLHAGSDIEIEHDFEGDRPAKHLRPSAKIAPASPSLSADPAARHRQRQTRTKTRLRRRHSHNHANTVMDEPPPPPAAPPPPSQQESDAALLAPAVSAARETPEWLSTIEKVVKAVVSIHFCQTHAFDTDGSLASQATGFVVDAKRGLILTNRHVVGAGPFTGYVIFDNHEECDVRPVYRDPVHDFGFLKFDPSAIKYMTLTELPLRPDSARVGTEIRVVGNDAGEKLSILSGVISRLDRNAPDYGDGYCDFNTNYIQAAAAASGGSSGSPVVDLHGDVVALQAGGRCDGATTDYFLPLARPLRTLQCLQQGLPVTRGTIQTQWVLKPFDECRRLGLSPKWEATVRKQAPRETNMLICEVALVDGPADRKLEEGDVLLKVNGELLTQFIRLDDILDSSVGKELELLVQRNGQDVAVRVPVQDLHSITPDRYVTVSGATLHDLSYQQARLYAVPCKGVYLCEGGGAFHIENKYSGWLIDSVDKRKTPNLDAFIEVMKSIPDRKRVPVTYRHLTDLHIRGTTIITVDRHWQPTMRLAVRNDATGLWDFTSLGKPLPAEPEVPLHADFIKLPGVNHPAAHEIVNSFVKVSCQMPVKLDGHPSARRLGFGVVVDADQGLVVVSRAVVPIPLCDITVTVADSILVRARLVFAHPLQNYAIIKYDPSLVQAPVRSARLSTEYCKQGADVVFVGFNSNNRIVTAKTTITDITACSVPPNPEAPRHRSINLDAITVDTSLSTQCNSGVLLGEDGVVQALWFNYIGEDDGDSGHEITYHLGQATPSLLPVIKHIQETGAVPKLRIMGVEAYVIQMSQARTHGVSDEWIAKVSVANPERHELFMVRKVDSPGHNEKQLGPNHRMKEGDIILTLNGKLITYARDMDIQYDHEQLDALVVRGGKEKKLKIKTVATEDLETSRALYFCGMVLQRPHLAVRQQIMTLHSDIYVSARTRGSPSYQYGPSPTNFITGVNGVPTPDLDSFVKQVSKIPDNTYFRLRAVTFDNVPWVVTLKKNDHYFPMSEFVKDDSAPEGWRVISYGKDGMDADNVNADMMEEVTHDGGDLEPEGERE